MKFNSAKCKALRMGWGNPKHKYRLGREWIESSPEEKDLRVLVYEKLNMTQQYALSEQKDNHILGCIKRSVASRSRGGFCPSTLLWCDPSWSPASSSGALSTGKTDGVQLSQRWKQILARELAGLIDTALN